MSILYRYFQHTNRLNEPVAIAVPGNTEEGTLNVLRAAGWMEISRFTAMSMTLPVYLRLDVTVEYIPNFYHVLFERALAEHTAKALAHTDYYICGQQSEFEVHKRLEMTGVKKENKNAYS